MAVYIFYCKGIIQGTIKRNLGSAVFYFDATFLNSRVFLFFITILW